MKYVFVATGREIQVHSVSCQDIGRQFKGHHWDREGSSPEDAINTDIKFFEDDDQNFSAADYKIMSCVRAKTVKTVLKELSDKEYAICFRGKNGLDEVGVGTSFTAAKRAALQYAKEGATDVTIKLYEDGDLRHQWDLKNGQFVQYE